VQLGWKENMIKKQIFDFDTPVDRRATDSIKWDLYKGKDIIPLWVADMDFQSPPAILDALHRRIDHGIFGYSHASAELKQTVVSMLADQYDWKIETQWLVWLPGLVTGLNVACRAVGKEGDAVMTAVPVYHPFLSAPGHFQRELITVPLEESGNRWQFDFNRLEDAITPRTGLFLLCNPHNPVGRVYTKDELSILANICAKHDIIICSDEIHCGLILDEDKTHIPTATLDASIADRTITLMAPSKTFNTPGLGCAFAIISHDELRRQFVRAMAGIVPLVNAMGYEAALSAFRDCSAWHSALLDYLRQNRDIVVQEISNTAGLSMAPVEATYLAWIDVREAGLHNPVQFFEDAGVGLQDGKDFGGPGFVRLNFGCPRELLNQALARISKAMAAHRDKQGP
jgi:cystathionine beta-lyase